MAKGSGGTRSSRGKATAPMGGGRNQQIESAISDIQTEIDALNARNDSLFRDMELDGDNTEYYEGQIADNDSIILELEEEIHKLRLKQQKK